jgi:phenylacetate-CoA ligase
MGNSQNKKFIQKINSVKPVQILSYVESIYQLAKFAEDENIEVYSPRAVMTTAGTLYDNMRETISRVFDAPVFNRYGSREVGDIACECESHEGLHVSAPTHYVEILRPDGTPTDPGEVGEIVVTLLTNYAMPLIRYRIGDLGAWAESECSCGRAWPLLKEVKGRVSDTFVTEDGGELHGEFFTHLFYGEKWVKKFQVVQESLLKVKVFVIPSKYSELNDEGVQIKVENIKDRITSVIGEGCQVEVSFVKNIPRDDSGKYRYVISNVKK